jgi:hypothetical protein
VSDTRKNAARLVAGSDDVLFVAKALLTHMGSLRSVFLCTAKGPRPPHQAISMLVLTMATLVISIDFGAGTIFSMRPVLPLGPRARETNA